MSRLEAEPAAETKGLAELSSLMPVGFTMADGGVSVEEEIGKLLKLK